MARRAPESLADYLAVAVCPALIMLLVGSLVFFLIEVFYQGQYEGRLLFVMAMFVMAIVAIARISIEQDVGFATLYAIPLAGVVLLAMSYFVKIEGPLASVSMLVNACFMGIVWWSAHKLTWDCTLIDDMQDASGQGLLQGMGLDLAENAQASAPPATAAAPGMSARADDLEAVTQKPEPERPWFERWLANDRRPHAPGVWIIYFSLAALPLFGFGGWFVPGGDAVARGRVFQLLVVYVASGLGLLLATSFLGLRRYLRQRKLEMPLEMTATWTALGLALILVTLLTAAILPRPHAEYSLTQLPVVFTSAVRHASRMAMRHEGTEDKSNERAAKAEAREGQQAQEGATKREGESGEPGEPSKSGKAGSADDKRDSSGDSQKGDSHSNSQASRGGKKTDEAKGGKSKGSKSGKPDSERGNEAKGKATEDSSPADPQTESSEPRSPEFAKSESPQPQAESTSQPNSSVSQLASTVMQGVGVLFRWLFYVGLFCTAAVFGWIYRAELFAAWNKLLAELRELWASWFGGKKAAEVAAEASGPASPPPRPLASFADPFASGTARQMSWPELVRYTFEATEAWGREHNAPRQADQTPHEFAVALGQVEPQIGLPAQTLAAMYSQLAYAPRSGSTGSTTALQQLWRALRPAPVPPPVAMPHA